MAFTFTQKKAEYVRSEELLLFEKRMRHLCVC